MKKFLMTLAAVLCCTIVINSQPISEKQAMERALQYMDSNHSTANARRMAAPILKGKKKLTPVATEATKVYAFNIDGGGFIITSGDQRTLPVLGYSTTGSIDSEHMPENMRSWLKNYDKAIAELGDRTDFEDGEQTITSYGQRISPVRQARRAKRVAVESLVKTHWDQAEPYWNQVPKYQGANPNLQGKQCYVGCVATAMAQVMNYWQWPKTLPNGLSEYDYVTEYNGIEKTWHLSALPPTWFDWDNMLNDYSIYDPVSDSNTRLETTKAQDNAVATLMRYCGQSVQMAYGTYEMGGSGAFTNMVDDALVNDFGYKAAQFIDRVHFPSIDEWEEIIYGELAAGRPIVYCGQSDAGGHCFVCDGYDGNGLFHINWGWSGYDDGYFALAVLNPYNNTSAGSGSSGIGFCITEGAVVYTDPHMEKQPVLHGNYGTDFYQYVPIRIIDEDLVVVYYSFFGTHNEEADKAFGTIDKDGNLHPLFTFDPEESIVYCYEEKEYNYFYAEIDPTAFTPGQPVTLYPMLRLRHPGEQWQVIKPVEQNLTVCLNDEGKLDIRSNLKEYNLQMSDVAITSGTGRLNERNDVTIRVHNNESSDYINTLKLIPVYLGHVSPEMIGQAPVLAVGSQMECGAYIPANGEGDVTFSFVPEYGGIVVFCAFENNQEIGELSLVLNNDTLTDYNPYVENKSYLSRKGDQWYWNVELVDRIGVKMPHWIPSDRLVLRVRQYVDDECKVFATELNGLNEYLAALPDNCGNGDYTFSYKIPVEVGESGLYYFDSYLAEIVDDELLSYCCLQAYRFSIGDPTGIDELENAKPSSGVWSDLNGRQFSTKPVAKGVYISNGKKFIVK